MIIPSSSFEVSKIEFLYRAPTHGELLILKQKIEQCIKTAAQATDCECKINSNNEMQSVYKGLMYNKTMTEVFGKYANSMGKLLKIFFMKNNYS